MSARRNQAAWQRAATDLSGDLDRAAELSVQGIDRVADTTGLSRSTITDSMNRPVVTAPDNPRAYLCRPEFRIGTTPYWSPEQVARAAALAATARRARGMRPSVRDLPLVGQDVDVVGVREIAAATGRHEQTVRKWIAGSYSTAHIETVDDSSVAGSFPAPVGRRPQSRGHGVRPGNPETVYDRAAVRTWLDDEIGESASELASADAVAALRERLHRERVAASA